MVGWLVVLACLSASQQDRLNFHSFIFAAISLIATARALLSIIFFFSFLFDFFSFFISFYSPSSSHHSSRPVQFLRPTHFIPSEFTKYIHLFFFFFPLYFLFLFTISVFFFFFSYSRDFILHSNSQLHFNHQKCSLLLLLFHYYI